MSKQKTDDDDNQQIVGGMNSLSKIKDFAWEMTVSNCAGKTNLIAWRDEYISQINSGIQMDNISSPRGFKLKRYEDVKEDDVARILNEVYTIKNIRVSSDEEGEKFVTKDRYITAIFDEQEGIYYSMDEAFTPKVRCIKSGASAQFVAKVIEQLSAMVEMVEQESNIDLIPFKDCIFDYKTKSTIPFSPDHVFLWHVNCKFEDVKNAVNPVFPYEDGSGNWDFDSWILDVMSDEEEDVTLIYQIIGYIVRPLVDWQKSIWFYSRKGSSSKGTLITLFRKLVPSVSCNLSEMEKDFKLTEFFTRQAIAIFADENPVGTYIDKSDVYKAFTDGSAFQLNRKYRDPVTARALASIIQCLNELPLTSDKSGSFMRRQLCLEFKKSWTDGVKRKEIKKDFMCRPEVRAYVLKKALLDLPNYYTLMETQNTRDTANEIMVNNSYVAQFVEDVLMNCEYSLPFPVVYEVYKAWFAENVPNGRLQSSKVFVKELLDTIGDKDSRTNDKWYVDKRGSLKISGSYQDSVIKNPWHAIEKYDCLLGKITSERYESSKDAEKKLNLVFDKTQYTGGVFLRH